MELNIFQTPQALARAAAYHFVARCQRAVAQSNGFAAALSGGSTPRLLYELLADPHEPFRDRIEWKKCFFYFTDERHVPPDHPESNYRMAYEALFSRVPKTHVIRMSGEKPPHEAAEEYEHNLWEVFPDGPDLDVVLLGLGEDGHTASLFPGSSALEETERLVVAPWVEKLNAYRITLTLPVINAGQSVVFLVTGASKAEILRDVISKNENTNQSPAQDHARKRYPAQAVVPTNGEVSWFVDEAAARLCSINNSSNADGASDLLNKNP
jgi:6-phosphogluconolactonase